MQSIDYQIVIAYLVLLPLSGFLWKLKKKSSASDVILGGRLLTLPAFVASLVSTWYGGILGVGEYSYLYGISNWLVFGLPYYLAAIIFAFFLAEKARKSELISIPEKLRITYDDKTALAASIIIFLMTVPAAYVLMLGVLGEEVFGIPFYVGVIGGAFFSVVYLFLGGFKSVIKTDIIQFILMFIGFIMLVTLLFMNYGGIEFLKSNVPETHFSWHGGNSFWYIAVWYVIALSTLVEPAFYQRCYATKNIKTARKGILISVGFWICFDAMTTFSGLYAKALLPELANPVSAFPQLAMAVLPAGLLGIFILSLLATVMSTVDSYTFLAGSTFGYDIVPFFKTRYEKPIFFYIKIGMGLALFLSVLFALFFKSAIDIWHAFGSVGTPALLIPLFYAFVGKKKLPAKYGFISITVSGTVSLLWYISKQIKESGEFLLNIEPIFPGLLCSIIIFIYYFRQDNEKKSFLPEVK